MTMEIKGYNISIGYMGYCPQDSRANADGYALFDSEMDYMEYAADFLISKREN